MGRPEAIRIFDGADDIRRPISDVSTIILAIQTIFVYWSHEQ